jgi:hypothetical protein
LAGSITKDTDKMAGWGLGDVIAMALENEKEKQEHEREMEKLDKITAYKQKVKNTTSNNTSSNKSNNTSSNKSNNLLDNDLIKYGGVAVVVLIAYKLFM